MKCLSYKQYSNEISSFVKTASNIVMVIFFDWWILSALLGTVESVSGKPHILASV